MIVSVLVGMRMVMVVRIPVRMRLRMKKRLGGRDRGDLVPGCAFQRNGVDAPVAHPGFRKDPVRDVAHGLRGPEEDDRFQAVFVVQVHVHDGVHDVAVLVLVLRTSFPTPPALLRLSAWSSLS